ncbi:MAG: hypothetical protein ABW196_10165 [Solirubrobacterales bacterium]
MTVRSITSSRLISGGRGPVVMVTAVGAASGARAAAAAIACAASEPDRAALLLDLDEGRPPRPSPIATAGARALEERLNAHLPDARAVSRGQICQLPLPPDPRGIKQIASALPLVRESAGIVHLPPSLLRPALEEPRIHATAVLLRADLTESRALAALAVRDLMIQGLRVAVLKQPLGWLAARAALLGAIPAGVEVPPNRVLQRLLNPEDNKLRNCYPEGDGSEDDREENARPAPSIHSPR